MHSSCLGCIESPVTMLLLENSGQQDIASSCLKAKPVFLAIEDFEWWWVHCAVHANDC